DQGGASADHVERRVSTRLGASAARGPGGKGSARRNLRQVPSSPSGSRGAARRDALCQRRIELGDRRHTCAAGDESGGGAATASGDGRLCGGVATFAAAGAAPSPIDLCVAAARPARSVVRTLQRAIA